MTVMAVNPQVRAGTGSTPAKTAGARGAKAVPPAAAPSRRRGFTPLTPMRQQAAKSMRKLAGGIAEQHPDMAVHQHVRDAARMLESGNEEAAQRHLRAAMFALTPQSLHRNGVHDDGGHVSARGAMHSVHRHLLLVKDIQDVAERNQAAIRRDSYGDLESAPSLPSSPLHADPDAGYGPGALAQKPTARQPGGDRALNAPNRTNSGGSDPAVADPVGPQPKGSKQFARTWAEVAAVVDLASRNGVHVPGTDYNWKHTYIPLTEAAARSHGHGKVPKGWHAPGGSGSKGQAATKTRVARPTAPKAAVPAERPNTVIQPDPKTGELREMTQKETAEAAGKYATTLRPGSAERGEVTRQAMDIARGGPKWQQMKQDADALRPLVGKQAATPASPAKAAAAVKTARKPAAGNEKQLGLISERMSSGDRTSGEMKAGDMQEGHQAIAQAPAGIVGNDTHQTVNGHSVRGSFSDPWWMAKPGGGFAISQRWRSKAQDSYGYKGGEYVTTHVPAQDKRVLTPVSPDLMAKRMSQAAANAAVTNSMWAGGARRLQLHAYSWDDLASVVELSARTAQLEVTPAPRGKPGGPGLYDVSGLGHTAYLQQIVKALIEKRGMPPGKAYAIARGAIRRWSRGGGHVHPEVRAAAGAAEAGELAKQARAKAVHGHASTWDDVAAVVEMAMAAPVGPGRQPTAHQQHVAHQAHVAAKGQPSPAKSANASAQLRVGAGSPAGGQFAPAGSGSSGSKPMDAHQKHVAHLQHLATHGNPAQQKAAQSALARMKAGSGKKTAGKARATSTAKAPAKARPAAGTKTAAKRTRSKTTGKAAVSRTAGTKAKVTAHQKHLAHLAHVTHLQHLATHGNPAQRKAATAVLARLGVKP